MAGLGKVSDIDISQIPENFTFHDFCIHGNENTDSIHFGPEYTLMQSLHSSYPNQQFQIIKYAVGGSSLLDWAPEYDTVKAKITGNSRFGHMYQDLLKIVDSLVIPSQSEIVGILWMQGERDARIPEAGKDYYLNFSELIQSLRKDLNHPSLPILIGEVNPPADKYAALETVRQAQIDISYRDDHCYLIETDDLLKLADNLHYSSQGQMVLGERFAETIITVLDKR